jgi:putative hydrolase of the HAD superfamily
MIDHRGAHPPQPTKDPTELALAARYAPRIFLDQNEPFLPLVVGYTVFRADGYSPSFPRCIGLTPRGRQPAALAVEYAIWWDWDITHLYDLEHVWTFVGAGGDVVYSEGSWHGDFRGLRQWHDYGHTLLHDGTHPVAYAQPGKHGFAANVRMFHIIAGYVRECCNRDAGADGLLVTGIFEDTLAALKTQENDVLVQTYLKSRAFEPAFEWNRVFDITADFLIPWPMLSEWIPQRVDCLLTRLKADKDTAYPFSIRRAD